MFINKRIAKLNKRIKYDKNSITNKNGPTAIGTPDGKKPRGSLKWVCSRAIKKEAIKKVKEIWAGKIIKAVIVKVSGIIPVIFCQKIKKAKP